MTEIVKKTILEESFDELKETRMYRFFERAIDSQYALYALCLFVILDAFLLFIPMEIFLAAYAAKNRKLPLWLLTLLITTVSLLGYAITFGIGVAISGGTLGIIGNVFGADTIASVEGLLSRGAFVLAFTSAAGSLPMPLTPLSIGLGVFGASIVMYLLGAFFGRIIRYGVSLWVGRKFGVAALEAVLKNVMLFSGVLLLALVVIAIKLF